MGISLLPIVAALLLVVLFGAMLAVLGFRGRLVSTNPHCRRCRFDLGGLPISGLEARCPECGRGLDAPGAVRRGLRRKRPLMIALGVALVLIPIGLTSLALFARSRPNLHALKPDFWLMLEARTGNPGALSGQLAELLARLQNGALGTSNCSALISRALAVQADQAGAWDTAWGDILDFAAANSMLSDEQLKQNMRNSPRWTMLVRPTVVDGDDWVVCLMMSPGRVGNSPVGRVPLSLKAKLTEVRIGDRVVLTERWQAPSAVGIHSGGGSAMTRRLRVAGVEPGTHEVTVVWDLGVAPDYDQPSLVEWNEERSARVTVLPAGTAGVELIDDANIRDAVQKSLSLSQGLKISQPSGTTSTPHVGFGMRCTNPPMDLAFGVFARERLAADAPVGRLPREWQLGTVAFTRGSTCHYGGGADATGFDAAAVDLVLRPSVDAARGTLEICKIWNGEVVFRDVPLVGTKDGAAINPRSVPPVLPDAQSP